ncbi:MAG: glycoside hydrolase family 97 N-terminal domain-containing protein, partial [Labilibaculum sp.]|nr:glycoside hydrolase family 97 N-terminal domain-containing protein [Labilibaculum sp.]
MKIKITLLSFLIPLLVLAQDKSKAYKVVSPNKQIEFKLELTNKTLISIRNRGEVLLEPSEIAMDLNFEIIGKNPKVRKIKRKSISENLTPVIKLKEASVSNNYNELIIYFRGNYSISLRAFNEGVAYRFNTSFKNDIVVNSETGEYTFPENHNLWWGKETKFQSHNQVFYDYKSLEQTKKSDLASLPLIINAKNDLKIVITETDLNNYPGMWLRGTSSKVISRVSPKFPKTI